MQENPNRKKSVFKLALPVSSERIYLSGVVLAFLDFSESWHMTIVHQVSPRAGGVGGDLEAGVEGDGI